ncbi:MAG: hypothetical protein ACLGIN_18695 [Candidatus Sericytochromatia bacterium]
MFKRYLPVGLAAVMAIALVGCPKQVDVFGEAPAEHKAAEAAAEQAADQVALDWGPTLIGDNRNYAEAYTRATWIHTNLAAGEWAQAKVDLDFVRAQIDDLRGSTEVPSEVRTKVRTLMPVVQTLGRMIDREDPMALTLASGLVSTMQSMTGDQQVMAWLGQRFEGGGAGEVLNPDIVDDAQRTARRLALTVASGLTGDQRNYAEAYTRAAWVHTQLAVGEWEQAGEDLERVVAELSDLNRSEEVPAAVRQQIAPLIKRTETLGNLISRQDKQALVEANRLIASLNRLTSQEAVTAWLR